MYEILFEPCILKYLNYIYKKFPYDSTIHFYDPNLFYIFCVVLKMCF
jgi:hypothetical protein